MVTVRVALRFAADLVDVGNRPGYSGYIDIAKEHVNVTIPAPILATLTLHAAQLAKAADRARSEVVNELATALDSAPVVDAVLDWATAEGHALTADRALTYLVDDRDPAGLLANLRAHAPSDRRRDGALDEIATVYALAAEVIPPPAPGIRPRVPVQPVRA